MTAQIQIHLKHFCSKLITLALLLLMVFSTSFQMIQATAETPAPATPPVAAPKPTTPAKLSATKEDSRIGAITKCSVDKAKNPDALKNDPTAANNFIFECLRDIIRIVITISIILAVMNLMWIGIKFLNTFGNGDALTKELSDKITGFVVGAVILGLFATFIQVINPAALKIDKIFSAQVIADYKCLNKGLKNASLPSTGCAPNKQGSGSGGATAVSGGAQNDSEIDAILNGTDVAAKTELIKKLSDCDNLIALTTASATSECQKYQDYSKDYTPSPDAIELKNIQGNAFANNKVTIESVDGDIAYGAYYLKGKKYEYAFRFIGSCENSPIKKSGVTINRGDQINIDGCKVELS
jgi:hypothetical protein